MENPYDILKVAKDADIKELKKAYGRLIREYPPETHPEEFKKLRKAYETLTSKSAPKAKSIILNTQNSSNYTVHPELDFEQNAFFEYENADYNDENIYYEIEITPESDYKYVLNLYNSYLDMEYYDTAINMLNKAFDRSNKARSTNLIYYLELIKLYASIKDRENFKKTVNEFLELSDSENNAAVFNYIEKNLEAMAHELLKERKYFYAEFILSRLYQKFPHFENLTVHINRIKRIRYDSNKFLNDKHICECIKTLINLILDEDMDENIKKTELDKVYDVVEHYNSIAMIKSLRRLHSKYIDLYDIDSGYFLGLKERLIKRSPRYYLLTMLMSSKSILSIVIAFAIFITLSGLSSQGDSGKKSTLPSNANRYSNILNVKNNPSGLKLPGILPSGYSFEKGIVKNGDGTKSVESTSTVTFAKTLGNTSDVNYIGLTFKRGSSTINFEASYVNPDTYLNYIKGENIYDVKILTKTYKYFENEKEKGMFLAQLGPNNMKPNAGESSPPAVSSYILYKIYTNASDTCTKDDFAKITDGLQ